MKKFNLKTKSGETVHSVKAEDVIEARKIFSIIKKIEINDLLMIFIVEEDSWS